MKGYALNLGPFFTDDFQREVAVRVHGRDVVVDVYKYDEKGAGRGALVMSLALDSQVTTGRGGGADALGEALRVASFVARNLRGES